MENKFLDDEIELKEINNIKALYYKISYPNKRVNGDPIFIKWLETQKKERGDNGIVSYCKNCNLFFYFMNEKERNETKKICCESYNYGYICKYCKQILFVDSFCCTIGGLIDLIKYNLFNRRYEKEKNYFYDCLKFIPFIFLLILFINVNLAIFGSKRMRINNDEFSSYLGKDSYASNLFIIIAFFLGFLYFFIFIIPCTLLYIIYLLVYLLINLFLYVHNF